MKRTICAFLTTLVVVMLFFACVGSSDDDGEPGGGGEFTVTYSGNTNTGGTAPTDSTSYSLGETVTVLANTGALIKAGYKFDGWNTASDGSGTTYLEGETFTGTSNITLYAKWTTVSYSIGDTGPAGGYIFYINSNYATDGWKYLEAAPDDQSTGTGWGGDGTVTGATATAIGSGRTNTATILSVLTSATTSDCAAKVCDDLSVTNGGVTYTGWFLPSKDELNEMYDKLHNSALGGFEEYGYYWSSSEYNDGFAYRHYFQTGAGVQAEDYKFRTYRVRACRQL